MNYFRFNRQATSAPHKSRSNPEVNDRDAYIQPKEQPKGKIQTKIGELLARADELYGAAESANPVRGSMYIRPAHGQRGQLEVPGQRCIEVSHPIHPHNKLYGFGFHVITEHSRMTGRNERSRSSRHLVELQDEFVRRQLGQVVHSALFTLEGVIVNMKRLEDPLPYAFGVCVARSMMARHAELTQVHIGVHDTLPEHAMLDDLLVRRNASVLPVNRAPTMPPGWPPLPGR